MKRRRKTGRDGFQGWSPSAAAAWERVFGDPGTPVPRELPAENSHKSHSPPWREVPALPAEAFGALRRRVLCPCGCGMVMGHHA